MGNMETMGWIGAQMGAPWRRLAAAMVALWMAVGALAQGTASPVAFYCDFEGTLYGREGAANPFLAGGSLSFVDGGAGQGKALRFGGQDNWPDGRVRLAWEKSSLIMDGANAPDAKGVVSLKIRWTGERRWNDGKPAWLLLLSPAGSGAVTSKFKGTALGVVKEADNSLALRVYQFHDGRLNHYFQNAKSGASVADPDATPLRIPAGGLPPAEWARIRMGYDAKAGKVWLGLNDKIVSAKTVCLPGPWHVLLAGSPPTLDERSKDKGFDGEADDLIVDRRTPDDTPAAGTEPPAPLPPVAKPPTFTSQAVLLKGDETGEKIERMVRGHFDMVLRTQRANGGWAFTVAWPSGLCFMSTKVTIPYCREFFNGSKDANSAWIACQLLAGYEALGDKRYLEGAERTGQALLKMQRKEGFWNYAARYDAKTGAYESAYADTKAPFEDHVQSHPVALLYALGKMTGKKEYTDAANKGVGFIYRGQNPNGSWSHHYNFEKKAGESRNGDVGGGEINDDTTADQMTVMLMAYRMTGEPAYLASYLRAADWLVSAFIDKKAKGWAQQYDAKNNPVPARHFEPAAISLSEGIETAPIELMRAYRMTGDRRYVEPLAKWRDWMWENRVFSNPEKTAWKWHVYYDPDDGQAFRYQDRKRLPPDPREMLEGGYTAILRQIEKIDKPLPPRVATPATAKSLIRAEDDAMSQPEKFRLSAMLSSFDWNVGTWTGWDTRPSGFSVFPQSVRATLLCHSVFQRRLLKGQVPWTHPRAAYAQDEWSNPFLFVLTPENLYNPLSAEEIAKARAAPGLK